MGDGPGTDVLVIADGGDLRRAHDTASWLGRPRVERVVVTLPGLTEAERQRAGQRLRALHNDCGCRTGELSLVLTAAAVWLAPLAAPVPRPGWPVVLLLLVLAAVGGKLLGLARSRHLLREELRRLRATTERERGGHDGRNRVP